MQKTLILAIFWNFADFREFGCYLCVSNCHLYSLSVTMSGFRCVRADEHEFRVTAQNLKNRVFSCFLHKCRRFSLIFDDFGWKLTILAGNRWFWLILHILHIWFSSCWDLRISLLWIFTSFSESELLQWVYKCYLGHFGAIDLSLWASQSLAARLNGNESVLFRTYMSYKCDI